MFTPHSCFYSCRVLDIHIVLTVLFCVHWFDENFLLCNYVFFFFLVFVRYCSFCGKLILMLFIFYLIRKCNLRWGQGSGCVCVCVCVCARGCVCVCESRCESVSGRWAQTERWRSRGRCSLFVSLSLLPERQGLNPNVSPNKLIDCFFDAWDAERPVGCFLTKHSETLQTSSSPESCLSQHCLKSIGPAALRLALRASSHSASDVQVLTVDLFGPAVLQNQPAPRCCFQFTFLQMFQTLTSNTFVTQSKNHQPERAAIQH